MQCHLPYSRGHFLPEEEVTTAIRQMALHILVRTTEGDTSVLNVHIAGQQCMYPY